MAYVLVLTAVTAVWGWTFVVIKDSIAHYPVAPFLALRFGLAVLVLLRHHPPPPAATLAADRGR